MISRIRSPFYIFFLNPVYVAARSLRSLCSNYHTTRDGSQEIHITATQHQTQVRIADLFFNCLKVQPKNSGLFYHINFFRQRLPANNHSLHLLLFIQRKYAIISPKSQTIMRKYVHLRQSAFNCAKYTLNKDISIIVNNQLSVTTFITVLRNSNSSKQLSFARDVNSVTSKEYSFA